MEHQTFRDQRDKYVLHPDDHRYHLIHPATSFPAGGHADRIHEQLSRIAQRAAEDADRLSKPRTGLGKDGRIVTLPPAITDPEGYTQAFQRAADFAPHLIQNVLDSPRGEQMGVQQAFKNLKVEYDPSLNNAQFIRDQKWGPEAGKHRLLLGGQTMMAAHSRDTGKMSHFDGASHLLSPEMILLHELGHVLDFGIGNSHPERGSLSFQNGPNPGMKLGYGLNFKHTYEGVERYAENGAIATLPPPFSRLHYPTAGGMTPGDKLLTAKTGEMPMETMFIADRQQRVTEWPTVLSEYGAADPGVLGALDSVFGRDEQGRGHAELVQGFWGFPFKSNPEGGRAANGAIILRKTLENGKKDSSFADFADTSSLIPPDSWHK